MIGYQNAQENGTAFDEIENYTIEQCEEYLQNYPKGLSAEKVRERLKSICIVRNWTYEQCSAYLQSFPNGTCADAVRSRMKSIISNNDRNQTNNTTEQVPTNDKQSNWSIIVFAVLAIVAFICGFLSWDWLRENFPTALGIIGGIVFLVYVLNDIFDWF